MSLIKSATRRLSLMAGSSLLAASLSTAVSMGLSLTPTAAFAFDECAPTPSTGTQTDGTNGVSDPTLNGTTADSFSCAAATYSTGIRYTASGDLLVSVVGTQISPATPTQSNYGTGGIGVTATGADDLTLRLTGNRTTFSSNFNTAFPVLLDARSQSGDVLVDVAIVKTNNDNPGNLSANNAATRRFVRAVSEGGGDVTVKISAGTPQGRGTSIIATGAVDAAAIEARSVGGGDVTVDLGVGTERIASGRLYGIIAEADGAGAVTVVGSATADTAIAGSAGLRVVAGAGPVTITGTIGNGNPIAFNGRTGVYADTDGDLDFTGTVQGSLYGMDLVNVAAGTTSTLNLFGASGGVAAVRAAGSGELLVNILGSQSAMNFDFTGMAAPVEVNFKPGSAWQPAANASSSVPDGNFSINIEDGAALITGATDISSSNVLEPATIVTFNPAASFHNAGVILVGPDSLSTSWQARQHEAELRFVGLTDFHHAGSIMLGGLGFPSQNLPGVVRIQSVTVSHTDRWYDDMLVFEDGTWIGEEGRVVFDIDLNGTQTSCARQAVTYDFGAADCLRIVDSTVEGLTYLSFTDLRAGDRGRLNQQIMDEGITLVETPGSTVGADNFALDPAMDGYNASSGSLDKGLYQYVLLFDEDAEQFRLFGTLSGAAYQLPMAASAAQSLWRLSAGGWFDRQADLRGAIEPGIGGGVWLRASGERAEREVTNVSTLGGLPFSVESNHTADTYAITGGVDLISADSETTAYVFGVMAGYAHSDVEYETSANTQAMDAWSGGLYASLISGGLFVDAAVSANNIIIDTDAPGFGLLPEGAILSSRLVSMGAQVEAGWRLPIGEGLFAEPLASVSYVRSKFDELQIKPDDFSRPGLEVAYDDPTSLRAGLGGRVGIDQDFGVVRTQFTVLGRVWNEFEGENTASIHNLAFPTDPDIAVVDDFSGQFNELALGASVYSAGGVVSGFLNLGGKFGDDYQAKTGSVGVRVAW